MRPKNARCISRVKIDWLIKNMEIQLSGMKGRHMLLFLQRMVMYTYCYTCIKRLAGAGHCISPNTIRMPNYKGLVFYVTWDKTLRMDSHCFGFLCVKQSQPWCAHCIIDRWVQTAKTHGFSFTQT